MKIWGDIKSGQGNQPELIELAIASLSSFFAYSPAEVRRHRCFPGLSHILILAGKITRQVEALAQECRAYLIRNRISVDPSEEHLERISLAIYEFVWEKGFRLAERTFHPNSQSLAAHRERQKFTSITLSTLVPQYTQKHYLHFIGLHLCLHRS